MEAPLLQPPHLRVAEKGILPQQERQRQPLAYVCTQTRFDKRLFDTGLRWFLRAKGIFVTRLPGKALKPVGMAPRDGIYMDNPTHRAATHKYVCHSRKIACGEVIWF